MRRLRHRVNQKSQKFFEYLSARTRPPDSGISDQSISSKESPNSVFSKPDVDQSSIRRKPSCREMEVTTLQKSKQKS